MTDSCKKRCKDCLEFRDIEDFYKTTSKYRNNRCKFCVSSIYAHRRALEKKPRISRIGRFGYAKGSPEHLKSAELTAKYGIDLRQYNKLLEDQSHACGICQSPSSEGRYFHVDHDHTTGHVRGLLCSRCNRGLGFFSDDRDRLNNAIIYLSKSKSFR